MAAAYQCSLKSQNSLYTVNDTRFLLQNQKLLPDIVMRNFGLVTIVKLKGLVEWVQFDIFYVLQKFSSGIWSSNPWGTPPVHDLSLHPCNDTTLRSICTWCPRKRPVNGLHNVDHLLLVLHGPVDLVVVTSAKVNHDVLVPAIRFMVFKQMKNYVSDLKKNMIVQGS